MPKYQKTLLAFSSNALNTPLANAFNYSSIKKRFTVMKTQTSKTTLWFRSLIILPLLAILIYGFSGKTIVEKEMPSLNEVENEINIFTDNNKTTNISDSPGIKKNNTKTKPIIKDETLIITILNDTTLSINGKKFAFNNFKNHIIEIAKTLTTEEKKKLTPIIVWESPDGNNIPKTKIKTINDILTKYKFQQTSVKTSDIIFDNNIEQEKQQEATEVDISTSKSQKYLNNNIKDIIIEIDLSKNIILNNKKILFKDLKEEVDKLNPNLSTEQKQLKGHIIIYSESFEKFAKKIKDLIIKNCNITHWKTSIKYNGEIIELQSFVSNLSKSERNARKEMELAKTLATYYALANSIEHHIKENKSIKDDDIERLTELYNAIPQERKGQNLVANFHNLYNVNLKPKTSNEITKKKQKEIIYYYNKKQITKEKATSLTNTEHLKAYLAVNDSLTNVYIYKENNFTNNSIQLIKDIEEFKSSRTSKKEISRINEGIKIIKEGLSKYKEPFSTIKN